MSTVLGRFVIPVYYVLGERIIAHFNGPQNRPSPAEEAPDAAAPAGQEVEPAPVGH